MIAWRRRRCVPDRGEVGAKGNKALSFCMVENARSLLQSVGEFFVCRLHSSKVLLPLAFKPAGDKPIVWIDSAIAPLGTLGFMGGRSTACRHCFSVASVSASSRSAAARLAASLAGAIAMRKVLANASSICTPPTFRQ